MCLDGPGFRVTETGVHKPRHMFNRLVRQFHYCLRPRPHKGGGGSSSRERATSTQAVSDI